MSGTLPLLAPALAVLTPTLMAPAPVLLVPAWRPVMPPVLVALPVAVPKLAFRSSTKPAGPLAVADPAPDQFVHRRLRAGHQLRDVAVVRFGRALAHDRHRRIVQHGETAGQERQRAPVADPCLLYTSRCV